MSKKTASATPCTTKNKQQPWQHQANEVSTHHLKLVWQEHWRSWPGSHYTRCPMTGHQPCLTSKFIFAFFCIGMTSHDIPVPSKQPLPSSPSSPIFPVPRLHVPCLRHRCRLHGEGRWHRGPGGLSERCRKPPCLPGHLYSISREITQQLIATICTHP